MPHAVVTRPVRKPVGLAPLTNEAAAGDSRICAAASGGGGGGALAKLGPSVPAIGGSTGAAGEQDAERQESGPEHGCLA